MKFAIINDAHVGPKEIGYKNGVQRKLMAESDRLVKEFVVKMNTIEQPEFVVNLGDSIEDVNNRQQDIESFQRILGYLSALTMPIYYLIGNHDVRTLTQDEIAKMLGYDRMYYSFDHQEYHFIGLSFVMTENHTIDMAAISAKIPDDEITWLEHDIDITDKPVIILSHYGIADDDMKGNFWFEKDPHHAILENRQELRSIFEKSKKVKAILSAHQHWNRMHVINGIPYFTVTSMVENTNNDGIASEAHTIVNITQEKIVVEVKGNDTARFQYKFSN